MATILEQMKANSEKWHTATPAVRKQLEATNQSLGKNAGLSYNSSAGTWSNAGGGQAYTVNKPASGGGYSAPATTVQATAPIATTPADRVYGHIKHFGKPEAYAQEIINKQASGKNLDDQEAADFFKQQNSHLFPGEQKKNILKQLQQAQQQPINAEQLPEFGAMQNVAKQRGDIASRQAMETLNQRGVLDSTITADRVAQIQQQAQTEILPTLLERAYGLRKEQAQQLTQLLNYYSKEEQNQQTMHLKAEEAKREEAKLQIAQKEKNIKAALDRIDALGYADNFAAQVLGIPVGTPSQAAKKAAEEQKIRLGQLKVSQGHLSVSQGQLEVAQGNLDLRGQELAQKGKEDISRKESADNYGLAYEELDKLAASNPKKSVGLGWLKQNKANFNDQDYKALVNYINSKDSPFD